MYFFIVINSKKFVFVFILLYLYCKYKINIEYYLYFLILKQKFLKMTITERLQDYMMYKGLNPNRVTVEAGLSVGLIGRAIKNNSGLNSDTIEKILYTYTDLNPEWFISESGEMLKTNNQNINNNGSGNNVNSNINGNISGNVTISHSEFSNMIEIQKGYQEIQKELTERLKTSQEQLSDSMRQVTILLEILKR